MAASLSRGAPAFRPAHGTARISASKRIECPSPFVACVNWDASLNRNRSKPHYPSAESIRTSTLFTSPTGWCVASMARPTTRGLGVGLLLLLLPLAVGAFLLQPMPPRGPCARARRSLTATAASMSTDDGDVLPVRGGRASIDLVHLNEWRRASAHRLPPHTRRARSHTHPCTGPRLAGLAGGAHGRSGLGHS